VKEKSCERCPCCSRHCRRDKLHCKKGVAHFDKLEAKKPAHKWEENLTPHGLAHRFILTGRGVRKRLAKGKLSEEAFLKALSESEQRTLDEILTSLEPLTRKQKKGEANHAR